MVTFSFFPPPEDDDDEEEDGAPEDDEDEDVNGLDEFVAWLNEWADDCCIPLFMTGGDDKVWDNVITLRELFKAAGWSGHESGVVDDDDPEEWATVRTFFGWIFPPEIPE